MANGHDVAMRLRAAYLTLHRRANALFAPQGVTADQFVLLTLLSERDGVTQQDIVRRSVSDANTVRAMLVLLERAGLVERRPHATDGRARCVLLTAEGRRVQAELWEDANGLHRVLEGALTAEETAALTGLLERVVRTMSRAEDQS